MKCSRTCLFLFLFAIVLFSLSFAKTVLPYSSNNIFTKEYAYEGFDLLGYSSNTNIPLVEDDKSSYLINGDVGECKKVYGFDGLFCKPYSADKKLDSFSGAPGSPAAFGSSSELSNSKGSLILTPEQMKLLQTRGGNQTGAPAEIGSN
jgi:hypothetical protein